MHLRPSSSKADDDLACLIENRITERTWGRIRQLRVAVTPDGLSVRGYTFSYYLKQLALQAVGEVLGSWDALPTHLDIEVGPAAAGVAEGYEVKVAGT